MGVVLALLTLAAAAFAAPRLGHPRLNSRVYAGHLSRASQDRLVFRVSRDGRAMQFRGRAVFTVTCTPNGPRAKRLKVLVVEREPDGNASALPAPLVVISRNGTFYGAGSHSFKPGAARRETFHYHFAGHFTDKGAAAVGRFFVNNCSSQPFRAALATVFAKPALAGSPGLVAAYAFDEGSGTTVTDASGNGNNGTIANATWSTSGKYGDALQFNGSDALVTIPDAASLHLSTGMTLEAWVNPSLVNGVWRDVVYKGNDNFYLEATSPDASRPDAGTIAGGTYADAYGTSALPANTWSFLTETYDGSTLRLYVNGTQVASTAHTGSIATSTNPLQIGGDSIYGQYFAGLIDNVRIYSFALTAAQIQTDQTTPVTSGPDTTPPSQPGTLSANAVSSGEIDLSWGASTDNVGVTGYNIERCQGAGCTNFTQIASVPSGTSYKDATVSASASYSYRVRATDAAGNLSPYSNTAGATTLAALSGLVAAYAFDEGSGTTVTDASGNGNSGTITNATWAASGKYGGALQFDGTSAMVTIPDSASLHLSSGMTLEAWVNPATVDDSWRDLIYKGDDSYYLEAGSDRQSNPGGGATFDGTQGHVFAPSPLPVDSWTHLAVSYDGATLRLYENGNEVAEAPQTGTIASSTHPLEIGGDSIYGQYFQGLIDEVRVYNVALTAAQIQTDMSTPIGSSDTTPPSQPGTLTATAVSGGEVDLSWGAATDDVGVTGYQIERCNDNGCSDFTALASTANTSYSDTSVNPATSYSYRVRATDAAGNLGPYSNVATVMTGSAVAPGTTAVLTYHNDNMRTGQDLNETVLTPSNVNSSSFGKRFSYPLDGLTFASPLYVPNVNIPGQGVHNVVIVATEHDSVYAFDADGRSSSPLWQVNFTDPAAGVTTVPAADTGETGDIPNEIGITGTPVIDPTTGTIYLVAATKEVSGGTTRYVQRLHALDLATGAEKSGGPVVIEASVPGTGDESSGGTVSFDSLRENQRTGGLLSNGVVYFAFSSHGDNDPFHGWVLGYDASTLQQAMVYNATPNGAHGGVWMNGDGIATDSTGSLYFISGDGTMDANTGGGDYGDSFIKLSTSGAVQDYFSPSVQSTLDSQDLDLGSGGVLLLPDQSGAHPHEMVSAGKNGTVYLVDRDNMGGYNSGSDQIVQELMNIFPNNSGIDGGNFSSPVYWNGSVYFAPVDGPVQAFGLTNGLLTTSPTSQTSQTYGGRGGTMSISANGASNGILWTLETGGTGVPGILHAYDATDLSRELYNSDQAGTRDQLDEWDKFTVPVVANGEVFVTSKSQLTVYGLLQ